MDIKITILFITFVFLGCYLGKKVEQFCGHSPSHQSQTHTLTNNSVSARMVPSAPLSSMGKERIYKHPHYYGMGTCGGNSYGEPFYKRTVNY